MAKRTGGDALKGDAGRGSREEADDDSMIDPDGEGADGADDVDDDEGDDDEEYVPPSKEDFEKMKAALAKANQQSKSWRMKARGKSTGRPASTGKGDGDGDGDDDGNVDERAEQIAAERWKPKVVASAARAAFASAGAKVVNARLIKLLDLDDIDVDDDGEIEGLDEQIEEIKEEFPHLFGSDDDDEDEQPRRRRVARIDGAGRKRSAGRPMSATEKQIASLNKR